MYVCQDVIKAQTPPLTFPMLYVCRALLAALSVPPPGRLAAAAASSCCWQPALAHLTATQLPWRECVAHFGVELRVLGAHELDAGLADGRHVGAGCGLRAVKEMTVGIIHQVLIP